jgi:hypothetical protein
MKEKDYVFNVKLEWTSFIPAESEEQAIEILKETYLNEHNIKLEDQEIELEGEFNE